MRCTVSGRATAAPTTTLPGVSLYSIAGLRPAVKELQIYNTTSTAFVAILNRLTTAGTQGAGLTEVCEDESTYTPVATGFAAHSVAPTLGGEVRRASIAAGQGAAAIWTFSDKGLVIPAGTANGLGIITTGTGQVFDYVIVWDE